MAVGGEEGKAGDGSVEGGGVGGWRWRLSRGEHVLELSLGGTLGVEEFLEGNGGVGTRGLAKSPGS